VACTHTPVTVAVAVASAVVVVVVSPSVRVASTVWVGSVEVSRMVPSVVVRVVAPASGSVMVIVEVVETGVASAEHAAVTIDPGKVVSSDGVDKGAVSRLRRAWMRVVVIVASVVTSVTVRVSLGMEVVLVTTGLKVVVSVSGTVVANVTTEVAVVVVNTSGVV